jgi:hypothetical protein
VKWLRVVLSFYALKWLFGFGAPQKFATFGARPASNKAQAGVRS